MSILLAKNIYKSFSSLEVLKKINIEIKSSKSISIMGASGEGKTTLLHILGGLDFPTKGEILFKNDKITTSTLRKSFGFIFQSYNLLEDFKVIDNIAMPSRILRKKSYKNAEKLIKKVGLEKKRNILTKVLSGGEKQRVAIARAFCNNPDIIFADEPSGNLDNKNSKMIHEMLINFAKEENKVLIVATHDEELANLCDEKYILKNGFLKL